MLITGIHPSLDLESQKALRHMIKQMISKARQKLSAKGYYLEAKAYQKQKQEFSFTDLTHEESKSGHLTPAKFKGRQI